MHLGFFSKLSLVQNIKNNNILFINHSHILSHYVLNYIENISILYSQINHFLNYFCLFHLFLFVCLLLSLASVAAHNTSHHPKPQIRFSELDPLKFIFKSYFIICIFNSYLIHHIFTHLKKVNSYKILFVILQSFYSLSSYLRKPVIKRAVPL